ncbi:MAG: lysostaphin resistance A-like protein [Cellulosilyticaceae bacterium]
MQTKRERKEKSIGRFVVLVTLASVLAIYGWMTLCHMSVQVYLTQILGSAEAGAAAATTVFTESVVFAFIAYVGMGISLLIAGCLMVKRHEGGKLQLQTIGLLKSEKSKRQFIIGTLMGAMIFSMSMIVESLLGLTSIQWQQLSSGSMSQKVGTLLIILVGMTFAAVSEEVVFRGIIQNYLMKKVKLPVSIGITAVLFSLLHIGRYSDPVTLLFILFPGAVFGYLFAKTKSLYMPMGVHYGWNVLCSIVGEGRTTFATDYLIPIETSANGDMAATLIVCMMYLVVLLGAWWFFRKTKV